jgi:hypothetical protein
MKQDFRLSFRTFLTCTVLYLCFRGYEKDISLAEDDIEGIEALYGERTVDNDISKIFSK